MANAYEMESGPMRVDVSAEAANDWEDPIEKRFKGKLKEDYLTILPENRRAFVEGYRSTLRWSTTKNKMNPAFQESDLDHILELLDWSNELEERYPKLYMALCKGDRAVWEEFQTMLTIHDSGEIHKNVRDLCRSDENFEKREGKLHKRKERFVGYMMMKNPELTGPFSDKLVKLYQRFEHKNPRDALVMLGHALDKGQATQNVARHQILFNMDRPEYSIAKACRQNVELTFGYVVSAMVGLRDGELVQDLASFMSEKVLAPFDKLGLPEVEEHQADIRRQFRMATIVL